MEACNNLADVNRRRFLRQSFAYSALAAIGSLPRIASALQSDPTATDLLIVGDWGYDDDHAAQSGVAKGMRKYVQQHGIKPQALLMLGDNW
jgi:tartrate-resistant acid phosphatase type 5